MQAEQEIIIVSTKQDHQAIVMQEQKIQSVSQEQANQTDRMTSTTESVQRRFNVTENTFESSKNTFEESLRPFALHVLPHLLEPMLEPFVCHFPPKKLIVLARWIHHRLLDSPKSRSKSIR